MGCGKRQHYAGRRQSAITMRWISNNAVDDLGDNGLSVAPGVFLVLGSNLLHYDGERSAIRLIILVYTNSGGGTAVSDGSAGRNSLTNR